MDDVLRGKTARVVTPMKKTSGQLDGQRSKEEDDYNFQGMTVLTNGPAARESHKIVMPANTQPRNACT